MESTGWRKKSTVTVLYSYSYPSSSSSQDGGEVSMREGERLILLEKSNTDWWQVRRPGDKSQPFYAPANYLQEDGLCKAKKAASASINSGLQTVQDVISGSGSYSSKSNRRSVDPHMMESRSDDCLQTPPPAKAADKWSMRVANAELRKQRSTSMDAIMFLELLENEIRDMPSGGASSNLNGKGKSANDTHSSGGRQQLKSESLVDRFKKPRISKDLWERRKSWAVEELTPAPLLLAHSPRHPPLKEETANINSKRRSMQSLLSTSTSTAPPLPPRLATSAHECQPSSRRDKTTDGGDDDDCDASATADSDKNIDKAPALPPKKNLNQGVVASTTASRMVDNYSRVIPLRSAAPTSSTGPFNGAGSVKVNVVIGRSNGSSSTRAESPCSSVSQTPKSVLSDSLEKLAQQIQTPLSYPHPIPPPRRSSSESMERSTTISSSSSSSPPQLPPKISIAKLHPVIAKPASTPHKYANLCSQHYMFIYYFIACLTLSLSLCLLYCDFSGSREMQSRPRKRPRIITSIC